MNWLDRIFPIRQEIPDPQPPASTSTANLNPSIAGGVTMVFLRSMRTPAQHWEDRVRYDAWGSPYTELSCGRGHGPSYGEIALREGGRTSETWLYGTEWKHKSGPPVRFPDDKPERPFS